MLRRGPAPEPQRAFKVELGRTNCVKYSDDNNPRFYTWWREPRRFLIKWSSPPKKHQRDRTQGGMAEMRRTAQQRRDHLSVVFQSVNSLSSAIWRADLRAQQPRQESRQIQRNHRHLWQPTSDRNTCEEACARTQSHSITVIIFKTAEPSSARPLSNIHTLSLPIED